MNSSHKLNVNLRIFNVIFYSRSYCIGTYNSNQNVLKRQKVRR